MDNDVSLHDLVELFVASPTSPRSPKTESGCKSYAHFYIAVSAVFLWGGNSGPESGNSGPPEVPAGAPEYPALFFIRGFFLSLFGVSLWRGSEILPRKFPRKFPGVRNFRSLVRNFRPKENLAKSFSRFLSGGGPELCTGYLLRKFPGHRKFRCKPRNIRPPAGISGPLTRNFRPPVSCNG